MSRMVRIYDETKRLKRGRSSVLDKLPANNSLKKRKYLLNKHNILWFCPKIYTKCVYLNEVNN